MKDNFDADQLPVHVCAALEQIMHLASCRLGIHGYCQEFPKKRCRKFSPWQSKGLIQVKTDICIKDTGITLPQKYMGADLHELFSVPLHSANMQHLQVSYRKNSNRQVYCIIHELSNFKHSYKPGLKTN